MMYQFSTVNFSIFYSPAIIFIKIAVLRKKGLNMIEMLIGKLIGLSGLNSSGLDLLDAEPNIGKEDRAIRAAVGAGALISLMIVKKGFIIRYLLGLAALGGLVTAYTKFSPVYALIGENTKKNKKKK